MVFVLNEKKQNKAVKELCEKEPAFQKVVDAYGNPPMWQREGGFASLLFIIIEQQVSLESARSTYEKLEAKLGTITPESFLSLDDSEQRTLTMSRQKTRYGRILAHAVLAEELDFSVLPKLSDQEVYNKLTALTGIGTWTANVYLLQVLLRADIWPKGDVALTAAYRDLWDVGRPTQDELEEIAVAWQPWRSVASRLLWHYYLCERGRVLD